MTNFQTLQTWLGHNATCYHNMNMLLHALLCIFREICLILGYLLQVTTSYHWFSRESISIYIFINVMIMHGKPLRIALNLTKLIQNRNIGDKMVFRWYSPSRRSRKSFQNINSLFHLKSYRTMTSAGSAPTQAYLAICWVSKCPEDDFESL